MFQSLACWCVAVSMAFGGIGVVDEPSALERTVEDVETLRVLVTNSLGASVASDLAQRGAIRSYSRAVAGKDDDDGEGKDDGGGDDGQAKSYQRAPNEAVSNWFASAHGQAWTSGVGSYYLADVEAATSYTRAFYAPGVGAWIDTNLTVPYSLDSAKDEQESSNSASDDDWAAAKRALRNEEAGGDADDDATTKLATFSLDSRRIDAAIEGVIEVLREHGHRIRGLASEESVVVALKIEGRSFDASDDARSRFLRSWTVNSPNFQSGVRLRIGSRPAVRTVVIRASKSLLEAAANGDVDEAAFAKRISITRY